MKIRNNLSLDREYKMETPIMKCSIYTCDNGEDIVVTCLCKGANKFRASLYTMEIETIIEDFIKTFGVEEK